MTEQRHADHTDHTDHAMDGAAALDKLEGVLVHEHTLPTVLQTVAELAVEAVPGATEASVTMLRGRRGVTVAQTGLLAYELDESQYGFGAGPCLTAASSGQTQVVEDMRTEDRWPEYTELARQKGALSSLSTPIPTRVDASVGLNVYSERPDTFDAAAQGLLTEFAVRSAVAVTNVFSYHEVREQVDGLQEAMRSRAAIEQAKGIVMALHGVDPEEAFRLLAEQSQRSNRRVRDLAVELVERTARSRRDGGGQPTVR